MLIKEESLKAAKEDKHLQTILYPFGDSLAQFG